MDLDVRGVQVLFLVQYVKYTFPIVHPPQPTQALPPNTLILINSFSCCAGTRDKFGHALRALLHLLSIGWQRPIACIACYRLGRDANNPRLPPARPCASWPCNGMDTDSEEEMGEYYNRLDCTLEMCDRWQCTVLGVGVLSQYGCQLPGRKILPHTACKYLHPRVCVWAVVRGQCVYVLSSVRINQRHVLSAGVCGLHGAQGARLLLPAGLWS